MALVPAHLGINDLYINIKTRFVPSLHNLGVHFFLGRTHCAAHFFLVKYRVTSHFCGAYLTIFHEAKPSVIWAIRTEWVCSNDII